MGGMVNAASEQARLPGRTRQPGSAHWADAEFIPCSDGKARPVEPGTFPLAHGIPGRVGRLRAFGNAIVPQVAAEFVTAFMECQP
jgi:DNA (cytosine-5)-methyltransferase 1